MIKFRPEIVCFLLASCFLTGPAWGAVTVREATLGEPTVVHLGEVWSGSATTVRLHITNPGDEDFRVRNVISSCGCTVPDRSLEVVPAGGSAELEVVFNAPDHEMERRTRLTLVPAEEGVNPVSFTLAATVTSIARLSPDALRFSVMPGSDASPEGQTQIARLTSTHSEPLAIREITTFPPGLFEATASSATLEPGGTTEIAVTLLPVQRSGGAPGRLEVLLGHESEPVLVTRLELHSDSGVHVSPMRLWFGRLSTGAVATETVRVTSEFQPDFAVTGASFSLAGMSAEVTQVASGESEVAVTFDTAAAQPGVLRGEMHLQTNAPNGETVTVPVLGIIRPN